MAVFHLSLKVGLKGKALNHFKYICAIGQYEKKRGVIFVEDGNMPEWASTDSAHFWAASDEYERKNGSSYREIEVSLPRELPLDRQIDLARQLVEDVCGNSHAYSLAIHDVVASDGGRNPHLHLQFCERIDDGITRDPKHYFKRADSKQPERGGCRKDTSWQAIKKGAQKAAESSQRLLEIRQFWEMVCNQALNDFGLSASIDSRSHEERGLSQKPQPKVGAKSWHQLQRLGQKNQRFQYWESVVATNKPILIDQATLEQQQLHANRNQLMTEAKSIRKELHEIRCNIPKAPTLKDAVARLVRNSSVGQKLWDEVERSEQSLMIMRSRHDQYRRIMDESLSFKNLWPKLVCWWNHTPRKTKGLYLNEAKRQHHQAQDEYTAFIQTAMQSPVMIAKAKSEISIMIEKIQLLQESIDSLNQRLSNVSNAIQSIDASLECLRNKGIIHIENLNWLHSNAGH